MIFEETKLKGVFIIKPEKMEDERGFFARSFCHKEFTEQGLNANVVQCSISYNYKKGTFRGMHYQAFPFGEDKIVSCTQGALLDFIVDLRTTSSTFRQGVTVELSAENGCMVYIPRSFAHGFLTLKDHTQLSYQMTQFYQRKYERGFRFNDPAFDIPFPFEPTIIAEKDMSYPDMLFEETLVTK
jgi:dTDP-4-dehydrorhamnose 3,5-epimerase